MRLVGFNLLASPAHSLTPSHSGAAGLNQTTRKPGIHKKAKFDARSFSPPPSRQSVVHGLGARLDATGHAANRPFALSSAMPLAASTFTTLAEIKPAPVAKRASAASLTTCSFVARNPSSEMKKQEPLTAGKESKISLGVMNVPVSGCCQLEKGIYEAMSMIFQIEHGEMNFSARRRLRDGWPRGFFRFLFGGCNCKDSCSSFCAGAFRFDSLPIAAMRKPHERRIGKTSFGKPKSFYSVSLKRA